jgi:hypothetical protein
VVIIFAINLGRSIVMKADELLDLIEDLGLTERQQIGTLIDQVEALDGESEEQGEDDEDE